MFSLACSALFLVINKLENCWFASVWFRHFRLITEFYELAFCSMCWFVLYRSFFLGYFSLLLLTLLFIVHLAFWVYGSTNITRRACLHRPLAGFSGFLGNPPIVCRPLAGFSGSKMEPLPEFV